MLSKNLKGLNPSMKTQLFPYWVKKGDTIKDHKDNRYFYWLHSWFVTKKILILRNPYVP